MFLIAVASMLSQTGLLNVYAIEQDAISVAYDTKFQGCLISKVRQPYAIDIAC